MYNDEDGVLLSEAARELGTTRTALSKKCDRDTTGDFYFIDSEGKRRIPYHVIEEWGVKPPHSDLYDYDPKFNIPKSEIWGDGLAKIIDLPRSKEWVTVGGISDVQIPFHDAKVVEASIELFKDLQPDLFVFNGDIIDFFEVSHFNKSFEMLRSLQPHLNMGKDFRKAYRDAMPNAQMHETMGNHEERLITYPHFNAPALKSLDCMDPRELMGLNDLEIQWWGRNGLRIQEDFVIEHGNLSSQMAGKKYLETRGISGLSGHSHRISSFNKTSYRGTETWQETGCLCQLLADYVIGPPNWQQGVWIGQFNTRKNLRMVDVIKTTGRGFVYGLKHYGDTGSPKQIETSARPNIIAPSDFEKQVLIGAR